PTAPHAKAFAVASTATSATPPPQGSSDPIKPILVKTIAVKAGAARNASVEPQPLQPAPPSADAAKIVATRPAPDPQTPILNPQPGGLGVLPPQVAAQPLSFPSAPPSMPPAPMLQATQVPLTVPAPPPSSDRVSASPVSASPVSASVASDVAPATPSNA